MQMGTGTVTAVTRDTKHLTGIHRVTFPDIDVLQVTIAYTPLGTIGTVVLDNNIVTASLLKARIDNLTLVLGGEDFLVFGSQINTVMGMVTVARRSNTVTIRHNKVQAGNREAVAVRNSNRRTLRGTRLCITGTSRGLHGSRTLTTHITDGSTALGGKGIGLTVETGEVIGIDLAHDGLGITVRIILGTLGITGTADGVGPLLGELLISGRDAMSGTITGVLTEEELGMVFYTLLHRAIDTEMSHPAVVVEDDSLTAIPTPPTVIVMDAEIVIGVLGIVAMLYPCLRQSDGGRDAVLDLLFHGSRGKALVELLLLWSHMSI